MVTIHDVARVAGVSIATVSNVVNGSEKVSPKTAERVQKVITELNYVPNVIAQGLKTNNSRSIGIVVEDIDSIGAPRMIDGIAGYCDEHNYSVILGQVGLIRKIKRFNWNYEQLDSSIDYKNDVAANITSLLRSRVSGIIYVGAHPRDVSRLIPDLDIPLVITYSYSSKGSMSVNYNDMQGAMLAVETLISYGHRRIGLICGPINSVPSHKRLIGYQTALMKHGIPYQPDYICTSNGNWWFEDGEVLCEKLLSLDTVPTAIFAMSDLMAFGAIKAARSHGLRIPEDLSIHGFDDTDAAGFITPPLTTISIPMNELGLRSAMSIISLIENSTSEAEDILLPCEQVLRQSVVSPIEIN